MLEDYVLILNDLENVHFRIVRASDSVSIPPPPPPSPPLLFVFGVEEKVGEY